MKKTVSILLLLLLLIPSFSVFVFAEKAHTMKPLYRKAWNVHIDLSDKTVIDEALADYDIMNMPAIECYDMFSFQLPKSDAWIWPTSSFIADGFDITKNYLLFCEKTGDVLRIRHNISEEKEEVKLLCIYKYHEYPTWLAEALGLGTHKPYLSDTQRVTRITEIRVCEASWTPVGHCMDEIVICFETNGGNFITVVDEDKLYTHARFSYSTGDYVITLPVEDYLDVLPEYLECFEKWDAQQEPMLGGAMEPSFFAAYMYGYRPEMNKNTTLALYIGIAVAVVAVIAIAVAIIIVIKKRRKAKLN